MKRLIFGSALVLSILGGCGTTPGQESTGLEMYYSHATADGLFFKEPYSNKNADVFVPFDAWTDWVGTEPSELQVGEKFTGVFDSEGYELLEIID